METTKKISLPYALAILFIPMIAVIFGGVILKVGYLIPLLVATTFASVIAISAGYKWKEIEGFIFRGTQRAIVPLSIITLVGILIAVWLQAGIISMFLYWGLKVLSPTYFLATTVIICIVFSVMTGTSFGTLGTAGLALLGVGEALGFPISLTVGAILTGAYFGDKMSPVSDTTNIAAGITDTPLFTHIGSMLYTTLPATVICIVLLHIIGLKYTGGALPDISAITDALSVNYNFSLFLFVPPILLAICAFRGVAALPTLVIAICAGIICAFVFQDNITLKNVMQYATSGYITETGNTLVDTILSRGGIMSMTTVMYLALFAMSLGGVLEGTGSLNVIVNSLNHFITGRASLIIAVYFSAYLLMIGTGNPLLSTVITARAFAKKFEEMNVQSRVLSRTLEDTITLMIPFVPYSVPAVFISGLFGIPVIEYIPYFFLPYCVQAVSLFYAFTGFAIWKIDPNKPIGNSK